MHTPPHPCTQLSGHPFFKHVRVLKDNTVFQKGQEVAETIRERWETSDSPLVHKIQDMSDSMFTENESARALREIRTRDPEFDMVSFLARVRADVVTVIQAYLGGDEEVLTQYCSAEMVERLMGIVRAMHAQVCAIFLSIFHLSSGFVVCIFYYC